jgi:hypothetical protein
MQGIANIGNAIESRANAGSGRRLHQSEEAVQGLTLSVALLGETRETFAPKQVHHLSALTLIKNTTTSR